MPNRKASSGPWGNPQVEAGRHAAKLTAVSHNQFSEGAVEVLDLTFRLTESGESFCTRLYIPKTCPEDSQARLSYLCLAFGVNKDNFMENPRIAVGKQITLEIGAIHSETANNGQPYWDVMYFLPPLKTDQMQNWTNQNLN